MKPSTTVVLFQKGDRVIRIETGEIGTVRRQFVDGYVSLTFDNGRPAELDSSSLKKVKTSR